MCGILRAMQGQGCAGHTRLMFPRTTLRRQAGRMMVPTVFLCGIALLTAGTLCAAVPETVSGYVVVPLAPKDNRIVLDATVNGKPAAFLLDTGAPFTTVLAKSATDFNLSRAHARGTSEIGSLVIGGAELRGASALTIEFNAKSDANAIWARSGVAGVLGWDTLRRWGAIVDIGHARLFLRTDKAVKNGVGAALQAAGWTAVPITMRNSNPLIPVTLGGREIRVIVDTGAVVTVFDIDSVRAAGIQPLGPGRPMNGIYQLHVPAQVANVPDLIAGKFHGGPFAIKALNFRNAFQQNFAGVYGVLGFDFLALHAAVIDCEKRQLYLRDLR